MQDTAKKVVLGSMAVAGVVALASLADLIIKVPFGGTSHTMLMDILFIVSSGIVIYLGLNSLKDLS
ncbi:hypothetical protein SH668x_001632 [Planctomicrobium sp. SH668]|uniref:hypothetical protein n=1 Tax=Planctomicrobium sp. SH668 TaxID=3448126 RepID=UPI003F5CADDF